MLAVVSKGTQDEKRRIRGAREYAHEVRPITTVDMVPRTHGSRQLCPSRTTIQIKKKTAVSPTTGLSALQYESDHTPGVLCNPHNKCLCSSGMVKVSPPIPAVLGCRVPVRPMLQSSLFAALFASRAPKGFAGYSQEHPVCLYS